MDKYKELYDLSIKLLFEEQNRFNRVDQKASLYLTALVFLLGLAGYFLKWTIDRFLPPDTLIEWLLMLIGMLLTASVVASWFIIFSIHQVHEVLKIPLTVEMIKFFEDNELIDIYYTLAKANQTAYEQNLVTTNRKFKRLAAAYRMMLCTGVLLVLFSVAYGFYSWSEEMEGENHSKTSAAVVAAGKALDAPSPQDQQPPQAAGSALPQAPQQAAPITPALKPNRNIKPPAYQRLTESYDPAKIRKNTVPLPPAASRPHGKEQVG